MLESSDRAPDSSGSRPGVGFVGLGRMGSAMAGRLLQAGHPVTVWSRSIEHVDALVDQGATRARNPADAIATGHVFSMLANEEVVREVLLPEVADAPDGFIHVNHATISARAADEFQRSAAERGHGYVAAPVIGRPPVAATGGLTIAVAGDPLAVDASMPMLAGLGRRIWSFGPVASAANLAKISVNYLIIHALQALAESITMLEHRGLDTDRFVEMIGDSVFPGAVYAGYGQSIARRTYSPPGFTSVLGLKDLDLAMNAADEMGAALPTGPILREIFQTAVREIGPDMGWSAIAEITRLRSDLRSSSPHRAGRD